MTAEMQLPQGGVLAQWYGVGFRGVRPPSAPGSNFPLTPPSSFALEVGPLPSLALPLEVGRHRESGGAMPGPPAFGAL